MFSGQPVALVVAENFELARYAASPVHVEYQPEPHATDLTQKRNQAYQPRKREFIDPPPPPRGNPEKAFANAAVQFEAEYSLPAEHHNPMEPFATTVAWEGDGKLTVYEKTQGSQNNQRYVCNPFGLPNAHTPPLSPHLPSRF